MFKFSEYSDKDYSSIRKILESMDIVAIQEILKPEAMTTLLLAMNNGNKGPWEGYWDSPRSKSDNAAEGYAFIWNSNRIDLATNRKGMKFKPRILNQYSVDKDLYIELLKKVKAYKHEDLSTYKMISQKAWEEKYAGENEVIQDRLLRNPLYGRFVDKENPNFEIRLINTHIVFSASKHKDGENAPNNYTASDVIRRKNEFNILSRAIYPKVANKDMDFWISERGWSLVDEKYLPAFTILMGDYNLNLLLGTPRLDKDQRDFKISPVTENNKKEKDKNTVQGERATLKANKSLTENNKWEKHIITVQGERTTLKTNKSLTETANPRITATLELARKGEEKSGKNPVKTAMHKNEDFTYANSFDHFTFDVNNVRLENVKYYRIQPEEMCYGEIKSDDPFKPFKEYRKKVSDHLPIVMELTI